jgi:hypothetical protein
MGGADLFQVRILNGTTSDVEESFHDPYCAVMMLSYLLFQYKICEWKGIATSFLSAGFQSLKILYLKCNKLEGPLLSSFIGLMFLEMLVDLSNNQFNGT